MQFNSKTDNLVTKKTAGLERHFFTALLLAAGALVMMRLWWPFHLPCKPGWPEAVLLLLATASTLAALARHLPLQNVLSAAFAIALAAGAAAWLDLKTGIPFGVFASGQNSGPKLFGALPWAMPAMWVLAILNSRGVTRLILRPWRKTKTYGFWLIGVTTALTVSFDLAFDPFASRVKHYWIWEPTKFPLTWQGAPLLNFLSWAVLTLLILAFVTPLLMNKKQTFQRPPDFHPLCVWLGGILLFGGAAALDGLWTATAADVAMGIVTTVFAIRGAKW